MPNVENPKLGDIKVILENLNKEKDKKRNSGHLLHWEGPKRAANGNGDAVSEI